MLTRLEEITMGVGLLLADARQLQAKRPTQAGVEIVAKLQEAYELCQQEQYHEALAIVQNLRGLAEQAVEEDEGKHRAH